MGRYTKSSILDDEVTGNLYLFFDLCISLYFPKEHELFIKLNALIEGRRKKINDHKILVEYPKIKNL